MKIQKNNIKYFIIALIIIASGISLELIIALTAQLFK